MVGLGGDEGRGGSDADGAVGAAFAGEDFAGVVCDASDFEGGVEAEADHFKGWRRGEGNRGFGGEMVSGGIDFSVDDVAGDVERGALSALGMKEGRERRGEEREQGQERSEGSLWESQ